MHVKAAERLAEPATVLPAAAQAQAGAGLASPQRDRARAGHDFSRVPVLQRQTAPAQPVSGARANFEDTMRRRFAVTSIRAGTMAEQVADLKTVTRGAAAAPDTLPGWTAWDPGADADVYGSIVDAFDDFDQVFGGVPPVREILFFDIEFAWSGPQSAWVRQADVGAKFGTGQLFVFRTGMNRTKGLPSARSDPSGRYETPVATLAPRPTEIAGAPVPLPSRDESRRRVIVHELGHGVAEAAMTPRPGGAPAADPAMIADFRRAAGWTAGPSPELYDVGDAAVSLALGAGGRPAPPARPITPDSWNAPIWSEQPMSRYAVEGGPGEDFAESVTAFVYSPSVLRQRSPARYRFLDERSSRWRALLLHIPQPGDYPLPRGDTRVA